MSIAIIIPAYNPDEKLKELVEALSTRDLGPLIVVNDGSDDDCREIFEAVKAVPGCNVLTHGVNAGKGRALKTAFNEVLIHHKDCKGVVTADADGQHRVIDIIAVAKNLLDTPDCLILGQRQFTGEIPFKSRFGNVLTRRVFSFLIGQKIEDTQTGLRGIPVSLLPALFTLSGECYEFEINMLVTASRQHLTIKEVPIETVYFDQNKRTHFHPLYDSMKIYFVLLRFSLSSVLTAVVDYVVWAICFEISAMLLMSLVVGRIVASLVNFALNKRFVFQSSRGVAFCLISYSALVVAVLAASYGLIIFFSQFLGVHERVAKIIAETCLFFFTFTIQRDYIFNETDRMDGPGRLESKAP